MELVGWTDFGRDALKATSHFVTHSCGRQPLSLRVWPGLFHSETAPTMSYVNLLQHGGQKCHMMPSHDTPINQQSAQPNTCLNGCLWGCEKELQDEPTGQYIDSIWAVQRKIGLHLISAKQSLQHWRSMYDSQAKNCSQHAFEFVFPSPNVGINEGAGKSSTTLGVFQSAQEKGMITEGTRKLFSNERMWCNPSLYDTWTSGWQYACVCSYVYVSVGHCYPTYSW